MAIIGKWKLSGANLLIDDSGNGHNLTNNNSVTTGTGQRGGANASGAFVRASSQFLSVADTAALSIQGAITLAAWVYSTTAGVQKVVAGKWDAAPNSSWVMQVIAANTIQVVGSATGTDTPLVHTTTATLAASTWTHLCWVYDPTLGTQRSKIYINGSLSNTNNTAITFADTNASFTIGAFPSAGSAWPGNIDDVYLDNTALSATEVAALYHLGDDFFKTTGTISFTEANDTVSVVGHVPTTGTISFTETDDTVAMTGEAATAGTISFTEANDTVAATGILATTGVVSFTESNDTVVVNGSLLIPQGGISFTEANDTIAITGILKNVSIIDFTEADDTVAISGGTLTTSYISFIEENDAVSMLGTVSAIVEPFSVTVRHKNTGAAITGLTTVYISINKPSTGDRWDFSDNTFKASPTTATLALDEVDSVNQPGLYRSLVTTTPWNGWIESEVTYNDGSYVYSWAGESYYTNGARANGSWSVVEHAAVQSVKTDTLTLLSNLTTVLNRIPASLVGGRMDSSIGSNLDKTGYSLSAAGIDSILDEVCEIEGSYTMRQALSIMLSVLAGVTTENGSVFKTPDGIVTRVTAELDNNSNRLSMTLTP